MKTKIEMFKEDAIEAMLNREESGVLCDYCGEIKPVTIRETSSLYDQSFCDDCLERME